MELGYGPNDGQPLVSETRTLPGGEIFSIVSRDVRRTSTGVHAWVGIAIDNTALADHTFNVERIDERVKLTSKAHARLNGLEPTITKSTMEGWLDGFCRALWPTWMGRISVEQMAGDLTVQPAVFLLKPYVLKGAGTIVYAPGGSGKSQTCMAMAITLDAGPAIKKEHRLWECEPHKMLYVNLERSRDSMRGRLARMNRALGLDPSRPLSFLNARGRALTDIAEVLVRDIRAGHIEGVVIDSISRAGMGDLNENEPANRIVDLLNSLDVFWIAIGHTPDADPEKLYGSVMFRNAADVMVRMRHNQELDADLGVSLEVTKGNDIGTFAPEYFGLRFDAVDGLQSIYRASASRFPALLATAKPTFQDAILNHLHDGPASATQIATATKLNRSNITTFLRTSNLVAFSHKVKQEVFYHVL